MGLVFTHQEVLNYLEFLDLPTKFRDYASVPKDLEFLRVLHIYQIGKVPYENLAIHYSEDRNVEIDPRYIYKKIMAGRGRGGYCMELCVFYYNLLRAIGFNVYQTGIRIRLRNGPVPFGDYHRLSHTCSIVTFDNGDKYAVDVSFGGDGPTHPMKLEHGVPTSNLGTQEVQLTWETISQHVSGQKTWIYQYRNKPDLPWNHYYCFNEQEYLYGDFIVMNWFTSAHPESFQRESVLVVKFIREGEKIIGKVMMVNGEVKRNMGGRTELVMVCKTESDRVQALAEYFGLKLTEAEAAGIKGFQTDLDLPNTNAGVKPS